MCSCRQRSNRSCWWRKPISRGHSQGFPIYLSSKQLWLQVYSVALTTMPLDVTPSNLTFSFSCVHPRGWFRVCAEVPGRGSEDGERCLQTGQGERSCYHLYWWDWCYSHQEIWRTDWRWERHRHHGNIEISLSYLRLYCDLFVFSSPSSAITPKKSYS